MRRLTDRSSVRHRLGDLDVAGRRLRRPSHCARAVYGCSPPALAAIEEQITKQRTGARSAPESAHAIYGAVESAQQADEAGVERTILFNLSGHGHFDMAAYDNYLAGKLEDVALDDEEIERAQRALEGLPVPA